MERTYAPDASRGVMGVRTLPSMNRPAIVCVLMLLACRDRPRHDAGSEKTGETRRAPRANPSAQAAQCTFAAMRTLGTHAAPTGEISLTHVAGHLGLAWTTTSGAPAGIELRDDANQLRAVAPESVDSTATENAALWSRGVSLLDNRSALMVTSDREEASVDGPDAGHRIDAHCNDLVDPIYFTTSRGSESLALSTMYSCRTVIDAPAFVLGLATGAVPTVDDIRDVRLIARRNPLVRAPWNEDRFADALWSIPIAWPPAGDAGVGSMRVALSPEALVAVPASGTGYAVALTLQQKLYVGWISPQLTALGALHRVPTARSSAHGASLAWNGHEALVVFVDGDGPAARLYASRMAPLQGATAPVLLASPSAGGTILSPSVAAFGNGEWVAAWIEASVPGAAGVARVQPLTGSLGAREAPHAFGGATVGQVAVAARGERYIVAVRDGAQVSVGGARCPSGRSTAPTMGPAVGEELSPMSATRRAGSEGSTDSGVACFARPRRAFRLRVTPTGEAAGPEFAPAIVDVLSRGTQQHGDATAMRVRAANGATGWLFLAPDELGRECAAH